MIAPDEPFLRPVAKSWIPAKMTTAPAVNSHETVGPIEPHYALLINPFYPKDANASFGKHVLTPSLALTSFAATTPNHWRVEYFDENLLDGRPPFRPMPQVVGITVHLTFAQRAYKLADWYRARGSKVVFGGLHVLRWRSETVSSSGRAFCAMWKRAVWNRATLRLTKTTIAMILRHGGRFFPATAF